MKKKYFTALIPASNLDSKYKRIQIDSTLRVNFPPIAPLEEYGYPILKENFNKKIDSIPEFKTGHIIKKSSTWVIELPAEQFRPIFNIKDLHIILGNDNGSDWTPPELEYDIIRNWELGFFELIDWCVNEPLSNFELNLMWKIKKRRRKG